MCQMKYWVLGQIKGRFESFIYFHDSNFIPSMTTTITVIRYSENGSHILVVIPIIFFHVDDHKKSVGDH